MISPIRFLGNLSAHLFYLYQIVKRKPRSSLEVGCGTATHSIFLSYLGVYVVALDIKTNIVKAARINVKRLRGHVEFIVADSNRLPFRLKSFDVCFHQGLLEHFSDETILKILKKQLNVSQEVICSVPSFSYPYHDLGDERLLSISGWSEIFKRLRYCNGFSICKLTHYYPINLQLLKTTISFRRAPSHICIQLKG